MENDSIYPEFDKFFDHAFNSAVPHHGVIQQNRISARKYPSLPWYPPLRPDCAALHPILHCARLRTPSRNMTVAARQIAKKKTIGHLS